MFLKHLFCLLSTLIVITSCDFLTHTEESNSNDAIKIISNIPDSLYIESDDEREYGLTIRLVKDKDLTED